jgi:hypothetical protein
MSCCLYKHRSRPIDVSPTIESIQFNFILVFTLGLSWFFPILHPDVACPEEKLYRRVPVAPLTAVGIDKTG